MFLSWYFFFHREEKKDLEILPAPMHDVCIVGTGPYMDASSWLHKIEDPLFVHKNITVRKAVLSSLAIMTKVPIMDKIRNNESCNIH